MGQAPYSYVRNNAIWKSYNRAIALTNTQSLKIINNVAYDVMGHAVYFEEASEIYNCVLDNLIVNTKQSFSLMNTDMTPASMWISHPTNTFRNNHVAGSKYYGFWLDY